MRKFLTLISVAMFIIYCLWVSAAQAANEKVDYVVLGDSLASGHTPYGEKVGRDSQI